MCLSFKVYTTIIGITISSIEKGYIWTALLKKKGVSMLGEQPYTIDVYYKNII